MTPGKYVVRTSGKQTPNTPSRMLVASRVFSNDEQGTRTARCWLEYVKSEHPKDNVFIVEVLDYK